MLSHFFQYFIYVLEHVKGLENYEGQKLLSPTENTAPECLVGSTAF